jgi:hypothetical protein
MRDNVVAEANSSVRAPSVRASLIASTRSASAAPKSSARRALISDLARNALQCTLLRAESVALQGRVTAFDQMKELTSLKRAFPFLKEPPGQTLRQAIHDLHKGRAGNPNVQIT